MIADVSLTEAIQKGDMPLLEKYLADNPLLADGRTPDGVSLLLFALYCRNTEAAQVIKKHKPSMDAYEAVCCGDLERVRALIDPSPERINQPSPDGFSLLGFACFFGQVTVARYLVEKGAAIDAPSVNSFKVAPIHSAAAISSYPLVKLLVEKGADVNARQQGNFTALHAAAGHGVPEIVRLLLENGADAGAVTDAGETPLFLAEKNGHAEVAELIRSHVRGGD
ncbi:MAG TPA: ankyrin repeat domain-containing protein [Puia sp.]|nr:ankyrin repeat domain-containing protein [Puia sp.]